MIGSTEKVSKLIDSNDLDWIRIYLKELEEKPRHNEVLIEILRNRIKFILYNQK